MGGIISQGLIQVSLKKWGTAFADQWAGTTFLKLFGLEQITTPEVWVAVILSISVLVAIWLAARFTKGSWRYVLRSIGWGWVLSSIVVVLFVLADKTEITSPYYTMIPLLIPGVILLGVIPLVLVPIRVFTAGIAVLRSLESVCTASATGVEPEATGTQRSWFQRRPFLTAATSLGSIGVLVLIACLFSDHSPDTARSMTELDGLRQQAGSSNSATHLMSRQRIKPGITAPELRLAEFVHGEPMEEYADGKIHVIDFWATWCDPCLDSIPHMNELALKYHDDAVVIGVSGERPSVVSDFLAQQRPQSEQTWAESISYRIAIDQTNGMHQSLFRAAGQNGIPCVFVIGRGGVIEWIGHPAKLDKVLRLLVIGIFDRKSSSCLLYTSPSPRDRG